MKKLIILLLIGLITGQSCSITMPVAATSFNKIQGQSNQIMDLHRLKRGDRILVSTRTGQQLFGTFFVYYEKKIKSENKSENLYDTIKSLHPKIPSSGDTLTVQINHLSFHGVFVGLNYQQLLLRNDKGRMDIIPLNKINTLYCNGNICSANHIKSVYRETPSHFILQMNIDDEVREIDANEIHFVERYNQHNNVVMAFVGGIIIDICFIWFQIGTMTLPII